MRSPKPTLAYSAAPKAATITGVAMPFKPRIDKIAAFELINALSGYQLERVDQWSSNTCSSEQLAEWEKQGIYPIDIADRKYRAIGMPSATEFVIQHFKLERTRGVTLLVGLVNKNNGDGSLKKGQWRIAQLLQDFYELEENKHFHAEIISRAAHAVQCFIQVEDGKFHRSEEGFYEAFTDLVEKLHDVKSPFSVGRYMHDMWLAGVEVEDIESNVRFWMNNQRRVDARKEAAQKKFAETHFGPNEFWVQHKRGSAKGVVVFTDDRFFVQAVVRSGKYAYRVIKNSDGHMAIMSQRVDLSTLAAGLEHKEPGCWYYQPEMFTIINGGPQYTDTPATNIHTRMIVEMLKQALTDTPAPVMPAKKR